MGDFSEGYITDFVSGQPVKATPEETEAVQKFSEILVLGYGYRKAQLQTRPQYRVKARPSDSRKEYPVDIAVFTSDSKNEDTLRLIVECKRKNLRDGVGQLKDYLRFSKASVGIWFNGEERHVIRKIEKAGSVIFKNLPDFPREGQRIEDIGKFKRKDLRTPPNLKIIFRTMRNYLAANVVGATRDETLARELINFIFCKIYDERFTKPDDFVNFRVGIGEPANIVAKRINEIFKKVKAEYHEVIDANEKIEIDNESISYVVGQIQNYCLSDANRDVVAAAFETFIGYTTKGENGQFFTPRNVVRLIVDIVNPGVKDSVLDPACGTGSFLVESLRHMWRQQKNQSDELGWKESFLQDARTKIAMNNIRGIEKDSFLSKVTKAYMAIVGDGKGGIFCEDSLEKPEFWTNAHEKIKLGTFDIVLTNPPFGKEMMVDGEEKLRQYDLAYGANKMNIEILFVERCLQFLKDGGFLGIILPETFFHAPRKKPVMQYMEKHNIVWIVDLPHNSFRPYNNSKCIVIILQKNTEQQKEINFAVAEEIGHNHQGKEMYRWDSILEKVDRTKIWDDTTLIQEEVRNKKQIKYTFSKSSAEVKEKGIFVPRYYWLTKENDLKKQAKDKKLQLVPLKDLVDENILGVWDGHGSPASENKGRGDIPYIRVKDIVNWEIYKDPTSKIPRHVYKNIKGNKNICVGDVLYVKRGSYRIGSVAIVSPNDLEVLLTKEILIFRVIESNNTFGLNPYYLLYLFSHPLVAMQTKSKVLIETTLPNIADRWKEVMLPIHKNREQADKVGQRIQEAIEGKWEATEKIHSVMEEITS